ncbi:LuxR C-terminal-related transcriptional regulator [Alkalicoccobacillus gibsonii]|uniref:LuxR C-terminal-related transcriptional regulator n=1 Tax=Alkalicoccobacillus gibsonii TaxID=79881 RepID=UPI003519A085
MLDESSTLHTIRIEMRETLSNYCTFDAYYISTVDPTTLLPTGSLTDPRIESIHNELLHNEFKENENVARILHLENGEETRLKEILAPADFGDELRVPLMYRNQCWGVIHLFRTKASSSFTQEDLSLISNLSRSFASKIANHFQHTKVQGHVTPGTVITDTNFNMIYSNEHGQLWLDTLKTIEHINTNQTPRSVQGLLARLDIDKATSKKLILNSADEGFFQIRAEKLQDHHSDEVIAFHFENVSFADQYTYAKNQYELSEREGDVTDCVLKGYTTKKIAETLFISMHTAQDHLKSIFRKVDVHTRRDLINKLMGKT